MSKDPNFTQRAEAFMDSVHDRPLLPIAVLADFARHQWMDGYAAGKVEQRETARVPGANMPPPRLLRPLPPDAPPAPAGVKGETSFNREAGIVCQKCGLQMKPVFMGNACICFYCPRCNAEAPA